LKPGPQEFGLIGFPLEHSASALYFSNKFKRERLDGFTYSLFPLPSADGILPLISSLPHLQGLNVTIPHKQSIIPWLNYIDPVAKEIGAVNTLLIRRSGKGFDLCGYNTDAEGFRLSLRPGFMHTHALILGTGGSSKAVEYSLKKMQLDVLKVSRTFRAPGIICYDDLSPEILRKFTFIVNCTPAGMFPETETSPQLPVGLLGPSHEVYDLIYNPSETKLLREARKAGAITCNGMKMLELQAELSFKIWMGR